MRIVGIGCTLLVTPLVWGLACRFDRYEVVPRWNVVLRLGPLSLNVSPIFGLTS